MRGKTLTIVNLFRDSIGGTFGTMLIMFGMQVSKPNPTLTQSQPNPTKGNPTRPTYPPLPSHYHHTSHHRNKHITPISNPYPFPGHHAG